MIMATEKDILQDLDRYLTAVMNGREVVIEAKGERFKLVPFQSAVSPLTDSIAGILKGNYDFDEMRAERIEKRESIDRYQRNT